MKTTKTNEYRLVLCGQDNPANHETFHFTNKREAVRFTREFDGAVDLYCNAVLIASRGNEDAKLSWYKSL